MGVIVWTLFLLAPDGVGERDAPSLPREPEDRVIMGGVTL